VDFLCGQKSLLAAAKRNHHGVLQFVAASQDIDIGIGFDVVQGMQMNCSGNGFPGGETGKPRLAAERQGRQSRAAFAKGPFKKRIMAAADDERCVRARHTSWPRDTGGEPMIEFGFRKQPSAGDLRAGHRSLRHHFVDLAFLEPEIGGSLGRGEKLHDLDLHRYAPVLGCPKAQK
jgi:hypothetical protein